MPYLLLLAGLIGLYLLIRLIPSKKRARKYGFHTTAIVESYKTEPDPDVDTMYFPVFQFKIQTGEVLRISSTTGCSHKRFAIGEAVDIIYYKNKVWESKSFWETTPPFIKSILKNFAILFGIIAAITLAVTLIVLSFV